MDQILSIPCPSFDLALSAWDQRIPPLYSKRILCFPLNACVDLQQVILLLYEGLQHTVRELPWLAGSIVPPPADEGAPPWFRSIQAKGACCLVIKDLRTSISYAELRKTNFSQGALHADQLCPFPADMYWQVDPVDVCRVQANFVDGGLLLVVSIAHTICDGAGISEVMRVFASNVRRTSLGEIMDPTALPPLPFHLDRRSLISGGGAAGSFDKNPAWKPAGQLAISPTENVCRTFRITADKLHALKNKIIATASTQGTDGLRLSTHDAISSLLFTRVMLARHRAGIIKDDDEVTMTIMVDTRGRLGLSEAYHGNAVFVVNVSLPLSQCSNPGVLGHVARQTRFELDALSGEQFRDLVAIVERREFPIIFRSFEQLHDRAFALTSYWRFDMHALDFGAPLGHIDAFRLPATGVMPGMHVVLPRLPDGGCELMVTESVQTMKDLMRDEEWARIAVPLE
jgi:hypothetical protein